MVYLVDDDEDDIELVKHALVTYSYKGPVDTSMNGRVLLDKLAKPHEPSDVIVMDLNMPIKNGFDTLSEIKSNPSLKNIPVIILTASSSKQDEVRCFDLGCNYFFNKPTSMEDYTSLVHMVKNFIAKAAG